tara:strand:- start:851 stop:1138 length:288 start_codon:yes stop_codon:yes gene_type:complete
MTRHWPPTPGVNTARPTPWRGLSREEAAQYIGISPTTFDEMVKDGRMPKPKRVRLDKDSETRGRTIWDIRSLDLCFDALAGDDESDTNPFDDDAE